MTSAPPQLILHLGAPKCGSTALQSALSLTPDLVDASGRRLRYTAGLAGGRRGRVLYGREVTLAAQTSPYGYASWPNFGSQQSEARLFAMLHRARRAGLRAGHVPVASCEGWIHRADAFARQLARWGYPPVEVVAFLRPVVDWTNSAFWQWGVWQVATLDRWLKQGTLPYRFGADLEAWSRIPNLRLRFAPARPDAVARFAGWQGVHLPPAPTRNTASSPALIGVLLRHRRLRPDGHDAAVEFVVQRWCPPVPGRRLWAVLARHVHALRATARDNLETLSRIAPDAAARELCADPRWLEEKPYHGEILAGVSPLNDPAQLAGLHASLAAGLQRLAEAAGAPAPDLPPCPAARSDLAVWDAALVAMLDALLRADARLRAAAWRGQGIAGLRLRLTGALALRPGQLLSRSR